MLSASRARTLKHETKAKLAPAQDAHPAVIALCARSGLVRSLWQPFADLSEQDRNIWIACMWEGLPIAEVASAESLGLEAVRLHLREIARNMDACLEDARALPSGAAETRPEWTRQLFAAAVESRILS